METDGLPEVERRYANWLQVGFTRDEFVLDFGQAFDAQEPQIHTGIVTTPSVLRAMLSTLQVSSEEHRRAFPAEDHAGGSR